MEKKQSGCGLPATYEAPSTVRQRVETEGCLCGSATLQNPNNNSNGQIDAHEVNSNFEYELGDDASWVKQ